MLIMMTEHADAAPTSVIPHTVRPSTAARPLLKRGRGYHAFLRIGSSRLHPAKPESGAIIPAARTGPWPSARTEAAPNAFADDRFSVWRRALDIVLALAASLVLLPLLILISIAILLQRDGPVLFVQERIGCGGRPFRCLKFRSMVPDAQARLAAVLAADPELQLEWNRFRKLKRDPRSTKFGEFLRSTSLDELPQLYNIIKGEMSLVGPRPILHSELPLYGRWLNCYTSVRPGLTGLWQVSGRNHVSYRRRVAMDRFYARAFSSKLYFSILLATIPPFCCDADRIEPTIKIERTH